MAKEDANVYQREMDWFKANEFPDCALLVDNALLRFLVARKRVALQRNRRLTDLPKGGKAAIWKWLWQNVAFSMEDFAALSGTSVMKTAETFKMLSGNGMVYPYGTLNTYVDRLLKARTVLLFQKNQPHNTRKDKPGPQSAKEH